MKKKTITTGLVIFCIMVLAYFAIAPYAGLPTPSPKNQTANIVCYSPIVVASGDVINITLHPGFFTVGGVTLQVRKQDHWQVVGDHGYVNNISYNPYGNFIVPDLEIPGSKTVNVSVQRGDISLMQQVEC